MYRVPLYLAILTLYPALQNQQKSTEQNLDFAAVPWPTKLNAPKKIKQSFIKQIDDWKDKIAQLELDTWNLEKHRGHYQNELTFYRSCVLYITEEKIPPRPCNSREPAISEYYQ